MKILAVVSTLDLKYKMGCTPAWWQLFKALHEIGNEVVVVPYLGSPVDSLWWRTYPNPCTWESVTYNKFLTWRKHRGVSPSKRTVISPVFDALIRFRIKPKWEKHLINILSKEKNIDCVIFLNIPINHIAGIPDKIKKKFNLPVVYYDGDIPTSLPQFTVDRGFRFNYYEGADLSEYDAFFSSSKGCIPELEKMGAQNIHPLYYGADPTLCAPVDVNKDIDVSFFGYGSDYREEWMRKLITVPSINMPDVRFAVAGGSFEMDLGKAELIGDLSYSEWRQFCCRSKINLNITRWSFANIYASSTFRPFELASYGACIVSQPYSGIDEWFDIGTELRVVNSSAEAIDTYRTLLASDELRNEMGKRARDRVLREHTFQLRARNIVDIIRSIA